jgi:hypothetical protein
MPMPLDMVDTGRFPVAARRGTWNEMRAMATMVHRTRLALAAFDDGHGLCQALRRLDDAGLAADQLGLAGRASVAAALAGACDTTISETSRQGVRGTGVSVAFEPLAMALGNEAVVISGGPFWRDLKCFGTRPDDALVIAAWMAPQLRQELAAHIDGGAMLLGVRALDLSQQKRSTQILLELSSYRVHTHEFNL